MVIDQNESQNYAYEKLDVKSKVSKSRKKLKLQSDRKFG